MSTGQPFRVVIVGGGVAGLEAALALRELAGDRVSLQIVAPNAEFTYRPMTVREPFAYSSAHRYPLAEIAGDVGAELITDEFSWVEPDQRTAHTEQGAELPYDALVLGLGARPRPPFSHAVTIDDRHMDELLHGIIQDVEGGYVHSLAFVVPARMGWPLPIYELALMTAQRADDMSVSVTITVVTPEDAPLAIFGGTASAAVGELLADAGIATITSAYAQVAEAGRVSIHPGDRSLEAERVIALPELFGPAVRGLPVAEHGFIPVDAHCQVRGAERVYAAGDATDFAVKQGGIAAQQADAAAQSIAALAGADVIPRPFHPEIRGILLTGRQPRYLTARITGGQGFSSQITDQPTWTPPTKIVAAYLAPYLEHRDHATPVG
jgi:sulfide:quinone oxidoreductase